MKECFICHEQFEPKRKDQKICKSDSCKKEQESIWRNKNKVIKTKKRKRCVVCKKLFTPHHKLQKTCGSSECIKANKNLQRRKEEHEFNCRICGDITWSSNPNVILCGKGSCRQKYLNEFNKNGKYSDKVRNHIKSKASISGFYSEDEIVFMIKSRLANKTNSFIALKLKRKLPSVEKKIIEIFKSEKYLFQIEDIKMELDVLKPSKATRNIDKWNQEIKNYFFKK